MMKKPFVTAILVAGLAGTTVSAQEVVQPLPPPSAQDLGDALGRLARDGGDVDAMLDAGEAALSLGDIEAAIGFFGRAKQKSPQNARVALGFARAYTASRRPVEALRFFAEAERAGVSQSRMAAERGLAFDLIGDSASAQLLYELAIANGGEAEVVRRLALSQAISGDRSGFEATLLPLLEQGDNAAFRTRAFGLAILGDTSQAVRIARDMMPPAMAQRIEPYLNYMTRLTPAQQAAAGNLGVFPNSGAAGRDTAEIAAADIAPVRIATTGATQTVAAPDRQLAPVGPVMGTRSQALQPGVSTPSAATPPPAPPPPAPPLAVTFPSVSTPAPAPVAPKPTLNEAFAGFAGQAPRAGRADGAVDISRIKAPREVAASPAPPPPPPVPARSWVQIATGKDRDALQFDWRRIARKADGMLERKGPFVTRWGEANRLLAGPYASAAEARETVNALKAKGIDSFPFASAQGEAIDTLD